MTKDEYTERLHALGDRLKPWLGLTEDEFQECQRQSMDAQLGILPHAFYRAVEAKLKEKNNG